MRTAVIAAASLLLFAAVPMVDAQAPPPACDPDYPCDPPPQDPWADCRAPIPPGLKYQAVWLINCVVPF